MTYLQSDFGRQKLIIGLCTRKFSTLFFLKHYQELLKIRPALPRRKRIVRTTCFLPGSRDWVGKWDEGWNRRRRSIVVHFPVWSELVYSKRVRCLQSKLKTGSNGLCFEKHIICRIRTELNEGFNVSLLSYLFSLSSKETNSSYESFDKQLCFLEAYLTPLLGQSQCTFFPKMGNAAV